MKKKLNSRRDKPTLKRFIKFKGLHPFLPRFNSFSFLFNRGLLIISSVFQFLENTLFLKPELKISYRFFYVIPFDFNFQNVLSSPSSAGTCTALALAIAITACTASASVIAASPTAKIPFFSWWFGTCFIYHNCSVHE